LLLHAKIKRHLICCHNLLVLTNQCQHSQIDVFCMTNSSNFLPSIRYSQNNAAGDKQKSTLAQTVGIFLERSPLKNKVHWTCNCQQKRKNTPNNRPQGLCRNSMIRSSCLEQTKLRAIKITANLKAFVIKCFFRTFQRLIGYC
jgi:hypothetical protein